MSPRNVTDRSAQFLAEEFAEAFIEVLGLDVAPIAAAMPTAIHWVEFLDQQMDHLLRLVTGDCLHLEFEDRYEPATLRRFLVYDALQLSRDGHRVHTTVVYTGAVRSAPDCLDGGSAQYRVRNVFLHEWNGEATLRTLRQKVESGAPLNLRDAVRLALVPLTRLGALAMEEAAGDALALLRGLPEDSVQAKLAAVIIGFCDKFLPAEAVWRLIEMARTISPLDELFAESEARGEARGEAKGEAKGMAKGEARGKAQAIVRVLRSRFGDLQTGLVERISAERDLATLDRWLDVALEAPSLVAFVRAISAER